MRGVKFLIKKRNKTETVQSSSVLHLQFNWKCLPLMSFSSAYEVMIHEGGGSIYLIKLSIFIFIIMKMTMKFWKTLVTQGRRGRGKVNYDQSPVCTFLQNHFIHQMWNTKSSSLMPDERLVTAWAEHDRCHVLPAPTAWAGQYLNTKIIPRPTRETLDFCKLELTDDIWWRVTRVNVITTHIIAHPLWLHDTFTSSSNSLRNSQRSAITSKVFTKS